ncbi:MAG: tRNA (adenosine(37)-N6)-dimethylallyltransferase MiaA, partial [Candidatus Binataceae bacterium]
MGTTADERLVVSQTDPPSGFSEPAPRTRIRAGFIVGPTGAGKTALALDVAERLGAEIVNADSRQFYRGMDLGTAKPTPAERARVRHHLIDVSAPDAPLDVAGFVKIARAAIKEIAARGRRALIVGGSGLYLRALRGGIFRGPGASVEVRARLAGEAAEHGLEHLHGRLREIDPVAAARIGHNDLYRIMRALEVFELTGEPISAHQARHAFSAREYESLTLGISPEREKLYQAIDARFDAMLSAGLLDEVRALLAAGYAPERPPLATIGYKQIARHLGGELTLAEAIALAKRDSRRLAKRQLTWFRADAELRWLDPAGPTEHALELFA